MAKKGIHPKYYQDAVITNASTGETITVGSTKKEIKVALFLKNHPYSTGQASSASQDGRVVRFNKRFPKLKK